MQRAVIGLGPLSVSQQRHGVVRASIVKGAFKSVSWQHCTWLTGAMLIKQGATQPGADFITQFWKQLGHSWAGASLQSSAARRTSAPWSFQQDVAIMLALAGGSRAANEGAW